ncbi:unnamed protein product [Chrysodeixis includens]|uniref:Uncharacterized protein n=1 Tax=Chrysodeixis includens TaxID=689277 RepID=A0A9P0FYE9_CHRIL|nr:unnamed protein product [Chrysodeixis includens]
MSKYILILCVLSVFLIAEATCQRVYIPTYQPQKHPVDLRAKREVAQPLVFHGEETYPGPGFEEVSEIEHHGERVGRSLGTQRRICGCGGSRPTSSPNIKLPGHNHRNTRSLPSYHLPGRDFPIPPTTPPFHPKPQYPWDPQPGRYPPIYA